MYGGRIRLSCVVMEMWASCTLLTFLGQDGRFEKGAGGAFEGLMLMLMLVYVLVRKGCTFGVDLLNFFDRDLM